MFRKKRTLSAMAVAATLTAPVALAAAGPARADVPSPAVFSDATGDVDPGKLDIGRVKVTNTANALVVRVGFPGVAKTFDYPTGNVSVWIDTDATRRDAEWGHFMEFWSDYRFAPVKRWREQAQVDGCVASVRSDKGSKLRFFTYTVKKRPGCLEAGAVRVAVSTTNTGDLDPFVEYDEPAYDHLGAKHQWSDWVQVS